MADTDGNEFDGRPRLDLLDDLAQVKFEVGAGVHGERGVVDRRAVGDHHQDAPALRAAH